MLRGIDLTGRLAVVTGRYSGLGWQTTAAQGAATRVWAATPPLLAGRGGLYCEDCDIVGCEIDEADAARLWALSAESTGVNAFVAGR
ncbi:hypothetical protein Pen02_56860 [Plantactinospora endophytica]|uniref:Uncharacterized protein n=1 Tax=Plantactinospora endophytica TaxID=673535 RepID=A0ABQ4E7Q1_9ACTN|nr:hypothetical protein Pen02_56860 [Plantactinospora endophytica]